jgi:CRP-like cAMP-binding protein
MMKKISDLLNDCVFFSHFPQEYLNLIGGCGKNRVVKPGQYLAHEGDAAQAFYVLKKGRVAIETHMQGHGSLLVETLGPGDIIGWSWLVEPFKWKFDVRVLEQAHLIELDGGCLRKKAEHNPELGYLLMKKIALVIAGRLSATRLQLIDIYGKGGH